MELFQIQISKKDVLQKTGRIQQLFGSRRYTLAQGSAKGTECVDVNCGEFCFTIVPDRGMDISRAAYRGCNLVYQTPAGEVNPAFYDAHGAGWTKSFFAGLLTTCGLDNLSGPCDDNGESLGLHGRYSNIPAENFCDLSHWENEKYILEFRGTVEQTLLLSQKLRVNRTIRATAGENRLFITDEIENFGLTASPLMLLYHINAGYPLLDEGCEVSFSPHEACGYNEYSQERIGSMNTVTPLVPGFPEENFLLAMQTPDAYAELKNPRLMGGVSMYVKWDSEELPYMTLWKNFDGVDYVMGMEPCNCPCKPREVHRRENTLPMIEPGETKKFGVEIGVKL